MARDCPGTTGNGFSVAETSAIDITGTALTVCCWAKIDVNNANNVFVNKGDQLAGGKQYFLFTDTAGKPNMIIGDASNLDQAVGATTVSTTAWHHFAGRKNGTGANALRVFLDGVSDGSVTSNRTIQNTTYPLEVGFRQTGSNLACDGLLGEIGIWDVALSDGEIAALARGVSPLLIRPQSLRGYWPLLGTGSPEADYSGRGTHLSMVGTVAAGTRHAPVMPFVMPTAIQTRAPGLPIFIDEAIVYVDILPGTTDIADTIDTGTVYVDLQSSGVDIREQFDTATIYLDLQVLGGECFSTFSSENFGEGEANLRWAGTSNLRWSTDEDLRWSASVSVGDAIHC